MKNVIYVIKKFTSLFTGEIVLKPSSIKSWDEL